MKCSLESITPIHIGNGEEIHPIEYLIEKDTFYRIDPTQLYSDKDFDGSRFTKFIEERAAEKKVPYIKDFGKELAIRNAKYQIESRVEVDDAHPPSIKEMIKTTGRPFIPGSSIKGSILSALYWHVLKEFTNASRENRDLLEACLTKNWNHLRTLRRDPGLAHYVAARFRRGREDIQINETLMNVVFENLVRREVRHLYIKELRRGGIRNMIKFAPWLHVTDTVPLPLDALYVGFCKVLGTARTIPIHYELLKPNRILTFEATIQHCKFAEKEILETCDAFYTKVLEKDLRWFKAKQFSVNLEPVRDQKYKIRLGQGSSSLAMSLIILAEDLNLLPRYLESWRITKFPQGPKTRKVIVEDKDTHLSLGWAKIIP